MSETIQLEVSEALLQQIDSLVGSEGRDRFLTEAIRLELKRRRFEAFLNQVGPSWKDEDHPELAAAGTAAWVHTLRQGSETGEIPTPTGQP